MVTRHGVASALTKGKDPPAQALDVSCAVVGEGVYARSMAIFAVTYRYSDDVAARDAHRPAHREFLGAQDWVLLSGPLSEPAGALIIVAAKDLAEAEERMAKDPFLAEGVVVERTIRGYSPLQGSAAPAFAAHLES